MAKSPKVTLGSNTPAAARPDNHVTEVRQSVFKDIRAKWGKFSEPELSRLKGREDLVGQIVAKYGIEKTQAQRDVDALLNGRQI